MVVFCFLRSGILLATDTEERPQVTCVIWPPVGTIGHLASKTGSNSPLVQAQTAPAQPGSDNLLVFRRRPQSGPLVQGHNAEGSDLKSAGKSN